MGRLIKFGAIGVAGLTATLALFLAVTAQSTTPAIRGADGAILTGAIAEERRINLGGVDQYVLIRGRDRNAPVMLFLHGGPGSSAMPFNRLHNAALEDDFVFVNWDQRGAGHSYSKDLDPAGITLDRITDDLDALVDMLCAEFNVDKILLVGHSWGSMLGLHYASLHPEKIAAFVGIGQMADTAESERLNYLWALEQAQARGDKKGLQSLKKVGAPPYADLAEMMTQRALINKYSGAWMTPKSDIQYALEFLKAAEFAWPHIPALANSGPFSGAILFDTFTALNAPADYPALDVPVTFMLGRFDRVVSPAPAAAYLETLEAPAKEVVWFEQSAHSPQWEEPDRYHRELRRIASAAGLL